MMARTRAKWKQACLCALLALALAACSSGQPAASQQASPADAEQPAVTEATDPMRQLDDLMTEMRQAVEDNGGTLPPDQLESYSDQAEELLNRIKHQEELKAEFDEAADAYDDFLREELGLDPLPEAEDPPEQTIFDEALDQMDQALKP